jgi:hypothetical protein
VIRPPDIADFGGTTVVVEDTVVSDARFSGAVVVPVNGVVLVGPSEGARAESTPITPTTTTMVTSATIKAAFGRAIFFFINFRLNLEIESAVDSVDTFGLKL